MNKLLIFIIFLFPTFSIADSVERVYVCGNDVGIKMKDTGYVVAQQSQLGEKRVDRILSVALTLVSTQRQTGFFDAGTPGYWCGISDARPITALGINK